MTLMFRSNVVLNQTDFQTYIYQIIEYLNVFINKKSKTIFKILDISNFYFFNYVKLVQKVKV
jgi:hypothetical protein